MERKQNDSSTLNFSNSELIKARKIKTITLELIPDRETLIIYYKTTTNLL